ncbi:hypothetical protein ACT3CD_16555 [Geofilum sp. OHC36d9]|uniref:hypothetical protein n=1 Tax=Geofilum sp. OHC36d9 TaxID=3458413 RepID=UPI00403392D9
MSENSSIELRSEKVRNIIGQIPSRIIRIGITVIFAVVIALLLGAYLFKFDHTINATAELYNENNKIHYIIELPYNKLKLLQTGQKLVILVHSENSLPATVQNIDTTLHINKEQSYFRVQGTIDYPDFKLDEPIEGQATVYIGKINVIDYALNNN